MDLTTHSSRSCVHLFSAAKMFSAGCWHWLKRTTRKATNPLGDFSEQSVSKRFSKRQCENMARAFRTTQVSTGAVLDATWLPRCVGSGLGLRLRSVVSRSATLARKANREFGPTCRAVTQSIKNMVRSTMQNRSIAWPEYAKRSLAQYIASPVSSWFGPVALHTTGGSNL